MAKLGLLRSAAREMDFAGGRVLLARERRHALTRRFFSRSLGLTVAVACGGPPDASDGPRPDAEPASNLVDESPEPSQPDGSPNAGLPEPVPSLRSGEYPGTYYVPVPIELEPYATFAVDSIRLEWRDDELELDYDLPELLLGESRGVSFRGRVAPDGSAVLTGSNGVAVCRTEGVDWSCREEFDDIVVDTVKIKRLLGALPDDEAGARQRVADRFTIDPIGVLSVTSIR